RLARESLVFHRTSFGSIRLGPRSTPHLRPACQPCRRRRRKAHAPSYAALRPHLTRSNGPPRASLLAIRDPLRKEMAMFSKVRTGVIALAVLGAIAVGASAIAGAASNSG